MIVIRIIIIITSVVTNIIFYAGNHCNYLITYYFFKCYLLREHLLLPY